MNEEQLIQFFFLQSLYLYIQYGKQWWGSSQKLFQSRDSSRQYFYCFKEVHFKLIHQLLCICYSDNRIQHINIMKSNISQYRCIFLGVARNTVPAIEIFLTYFLSVFTKTYYGRQHNADQFKEDDISMFFILFLQIYVLRSLIGSNISKQCLIKSARQNLFDLSRTAEQPQQAQLIKYSEAKIREFYEKDYKYFYKQKKNDIEYIEHVLNIERQIYSLLDNILRRTDDQNSQRQMISKQYLPDINAFHPRMFISYNIKAILNIKILWKLQMKELWRRFEPITKPFKICIPYIIETKKNQPQPNFLYIPAKSKACDLRSHLKNIHTIPSQLSKTQRIKIAKLVLQKSYQVYQKTYTFIPRFSSKHISIDRYNRPVINFLEPFLLQQMGLVGNTMTIQLKLMNASQLDIDFESSYLQTVPQNIILLERRYFLERSERHTGYKAELDERAKILEEKIHVRRLISIIYHIMTGRRFIDDYCNGLFRQLSQDQKRLLQNNLPLALLKSHKDFQDGTLNLQVIFSNNEQRINPPEKIFSFNLIDIMSFFGTYPKDQLLQGLKLAKISQPFQQRKQLMKLIQSFTEKQIDHKLFISPIRAFINSLLILHEDIYSLFQLYKNKVAFTLMPPSSQNPEKVDILLADLREIIQEKQLQRRKKFKNQIYKLDQFQKERSKHKKYANTKDHKQLYDFLIRLNKQYIFFRNRLRDYISSLQQREQFLKVYEDILQDALTLKEMYPKENLGEFIQDCVADHYSIHQYMGNIDQRLISYIIETIWTYDRFWSKTCLSRLQSLLCQIKVKLQKFIRQQVQPLRLKEYHMIKLEVLLKIYLMLDQDNAKRLRIPIEMLLQQHRQSTTLKQQIQRQRIAKFRKILQNIAI